MFGQDVDAAGPGSDAVNGGVQEQMGLVARRQLVRVSGPVAFTFSFTLSLVSPNWVRMKAGVLSRITAR